MGYVAIFTLVVIFARRYWAQCRRAGFDQRDSGQSGYPGSTGSYYGTDAGHGHGHSGWGGGHGGGGGHRGGGGGGGGHGG